MANKNTGVIKSNFAPEKASLIIKAQESYSEKIKELEDARKEINNIKNILEKYNAQTQHFITNLTNSVDSSSVDGPLYRKPIALLEGIFNKYFKENSVTNEMNKLIANYIRCRDALYNEQAVQKENFQNVEQTLDELIELQSSATTDLRKNLSLYEEGEKKSQEIDQRYSADKGNPDLLKEHLEAKRDMENVADELRKNELRCNISSNVTEAMLSYRGSVNIMLREGDILLNDIDEVIATTGPLMKFLAGASKIAELQDKMLNVHETLQVAVNTVLPAIARLSLAIGDAREKLITGELIDRDRVIPELKRIAEVAEKRSQDRAVQASERAKKLLEENNNNIIDITPEDG